MSRSAHLLPLPVTRSVLSAPELASPTHNNNSNSNNNNNNNNNGAGPTSPGELESPRPPRAPKPVSELHVRTASFTLIFSSRIVSSSY
jgi:hypothetical protein